MGTVTKLNDVLCVNISKVDDVLKANASKWDDNTFCPVSPTPTPTPTPSPAVNCKNGLIPDLTIYSFYDCCGILVEGTTTSGSELICYDANQLNSGVIDQGGSCSVSCVTPTPTPTPTQTPGGASPTPTPTPTPTPSPECIPFCCEAELCYFADCAGACDCNRSGLFYLSICAGQNCYLENATGIYTDNRCGNPAPTNYYADTTGCYYWDGTTLTYNGPC